MYCPFECVYRCGCAGRPVVKHQWKPVGGPADPHVETTAIRQLNVLKGVHAAILAFPPTGSGDYSYSWLMSTMQNRLPSGSSSTIKSGSSG
jgi:hypothetical protein